MRFDTALLLAAALLACGIAIGRHVRNSRLGWRAGVGTMGIFATCGALGLWVQVVVDPWQDGGTIEHFHADQVLGDPLTMLLVVTALLLFYLGQLPLGVSIGTAFALRHEKRGWARLCVCCLAAPAVFYGSAWIMVVATT